MAKLSINDIEVTDKRVFVRVDFNTPMKDGKVTDPARIVAAIPTIKLILEKGAKSVVLVSHLGRPDGRVQMKYTLKPVAEKLEELIGQKVTFVDEVVGEKALAASNAGGIVLLENVRFHVEEEGKGVAEDGSKVKAEADKVNEFRKNLAALGDVYVCDAFGTAHRGHSSMVGQYFPVRCAGLLLDVELTAFDRVLETPQKPVLAILGGAKVSDKILLIENMLKRVDELIVCGGMAYTFLKVHNGMKIGNSLFDAEGAKVVEHILKTAEEANVKLHFPIDFVTSQEFSDDAKTELATLEEGIPDGWEGLDAGPKTREMFREVILRAKTIVWNGPAGVFELKPFQAGTRAVLDAVCDATKTGAFVVVGGGDSAAAAAKFGRVEEISHCSTGGGASMSLLQGEVLPGVAALDDKE